MKFENNQKMIEKLQWERSSNYIGPDYSEYIVVIGRNRDSGNLDNYNYEAVTSHLKQFLKHEDSWELLEVSQGHWACGYIELLLIKKNSNEQLLNECRKTMNALEEYPVFDDSEFYEYEHEKLTEYFESEKSYWLTNFTEFLGLEKLSTDMEKDLLYFIQLSLEADASYRGADEAYFNYNCLKSLKRTLELIKDNCLEENFNTKKCLKIIKSKIAA